jgi:hypothetical protein
MPVCSSICTVSPSTLNISTSSSRPTSSSQSTNQKILTVDSAVDDVSLVPTPSPTYKVDTYLPTTFTPMLLPTYVCNPDPKNCG